ncbi:hypothetical protein O988_08447 [Pseudogymnoascus sp. VKM F-3808]|nr:hypothetical protein V490_07977 [Pseudogymnoascus sp. VKM F-3557]KFX89875.1 hypothetical protein O988_08447 [Pseudogymnoascus sp. VKM F-3808]KFY48999.1 hypothetical protein V495_00837 [Pseudogymnoascus sp. VKM F-4514 (FW-929)]KFY61034.1 hypothetical protein V497_03160 [Pseudogymnoascus sp. VKM F-4516 (FW-969)]
MYKIPCIETKDKENRQLSFPLLFFTFFTNCTITGIDTAGCRQVRGRKFDQLLTGAFPRSLKHQHPRYS